MHDAPRQPTPADIERAARALSDRVAAANRMHPDVAWKNFRDEAIEAVQVVVAALGESS